MPFIRIPVGGAVKVVAEEAKTKAAPPDQKAADSILIPPTLEVGPAGNIVVLKPQLKTKLVILTECDLEPDELVALNETTDDIMIVNDYNSKKRTIADLIKRCDVLLIDLTKYLRFYTESLKTIPSEVLVIKRAVRGLHVRAESYEGLEVDAVVKYLPDKKRETLAAYLEALGPHISKHVLYTASLADRIQVMLSK